MAGLFDSAKEVLVLVLVTVYNEDGSKITKSVLKKHAPDTRAGRTMFAVDLGRKLQRPAKKKGKG